MQKTRHPIRSVPTLQIGASSSATERALRMGCLKVGTWLSVRVYRSLPLGVNSGIKHGSQVGCGKTINSCCSCGCVFNVQVSMPPRRTRRPPRDDGRFDEWSAKLFFRYANLYPSAQCALVCYGAPKPRVIRHRECREPADNSRRDHVAWAGVIIVQVSGDAIDNMSSVID